MYDAELDSESLVKLFKVLSKPDALEIFLLADEGIENSTYAMEELGFTPKRFYSRMRELVDMGFISKTEGAYRQTPFGSMVYSSFLPAMERAYDARDRLGLIEKFKGTEIENKVKNLIEDELNIPSFAKSINVKTIDTYESMVVDVIDLCDESKESVLMASNHVDVRVMEATFRAVDRDVKNRIIMGKGRLPSKMQSLRMMFSLSFTKALINFASSTRDLTDVVRFVELPYTFCVVDGHRSIIEISDTLNEGFIVALLIDDRVVGEKLTEFHNTLWEAGESQPALNALNSIRS